MLIFVKISFAIARTRRRMSWSRPSLVNSTLQINGATVHSKVLSILNNATSVRSKEYYIIRVAQARERAPIHTSGPPYVIVITHSYSNIGFLLPRRGKSSRAEKKDGTSSTAQQLTDRRNSRADPRVPSNSERQPWLSYSCGKIILLQFLYKRGVLTSSPLDDLPVSVQECRSLS